MSKLKAAWNWVYGDKKSQKDWEHSISKQIVNLPGEKLVRAYQVEVLTSEELQWERVVLVISTARLMILDVSRLLVEIDIADLMHARSVRDEVHLTIRHDEKPIHVTVRTKSDNRARSLQRRAVASAEDRLAGKGPDPEVKVRHVVAAVMLAAAQAAAERKRAETDVDY